MYVYVTHLLCHAVLQTLKHMQKEENGLAHLDISSGNIMLNNTGGSWELKLLDFGFAQMLKHRE